MIKRVYKAGRRLTNEAASEIGEYLEGKAEEGVTPSEFVALAKPKRSPLHKYLEWDDAVAADSYREYEARNILNSIEIVVIDDHGTEVTTRAFHAISTSRERPERRYTPQHIVWSDEKMREEVLARAWRELLTWQERYHSYSELAGVHEAIGAALRERADQAA